MTLIVAGGTRGYAFHASDRLITTAGSGVANTWDAASNKTVIIMGSDCWLVIGYTGLAFLDSKPTDQFIAEAVTGLPDLSSSAFTGWGLPPGPMHYRGLTDRIENAMFEAYQRLPSNERTFPTTLLGAGLQKTSSPRVRQVVFEATVRATEVTHDELTERLQPNSRFYHHRVGTVLDPVVQKSRTDLKAGGDESPEAFRTLLMDEVQATAALSDVVGKDVVGVTLAPSENKIDFQFRPGDPTAPLPTPHGDDPDGWADHPRVYTPFLVTPGMIFHPALATIGGWIVGAGTAAPLNFVISGDGLQPGEGRAFTGSYPRRPKPR